jgi:hypothetical protein
MINIQVGDICIAVDWKCLVEVTHIKTDKECRAVVLSGGPLFKRPAEIDVTSVRWKDYIFERKLDSIGKEIAIYMQISPSKLERVGRSIRGVIVFDDESDFIPSDFFRKSF